MLVESLSWEVGVEENYAFESDVQQQHTFSRWNIIFPKVLQHSIYLELFTRMHENDSPHLTSSIKKRQREIILY